MNLSVLELSLVTPTNSSQSDTLRNITQFLH